MHVLVCFFFRCSFFPPLVIVLSSLVHSRRAHTCTVGRLDDESALATVKNWKGRGERKRQKQTGAAFFFFLIEKGKAAPPL